MRCGADLLQILLTAIIHGYDPGLSAKVRAVLGSFRITPRNGVYAKSTDGESDLFFSPEPYIYVINSLGGAGMTLSFGLAEELVAGLL